jgi:hypothetical protein
MKRNSFVILAALTVLFLSAGFVHSAPARVESQTGKVTAVDPEGKGIVISVGSGEAALDVGTIVQPDTKLMVNGKNEPISSLNDRVEVGDTVTLSYARTDDLYAKQIVKK